MLKSALLLATVSSLLLCSPANGQSKPRTIVMPPTRIVCDAACKDRVSQAREQEKTAAEQHQMLRLLERFLRGELVACAYEEPGVVWVRDKDAVGGECAPLRLATPRRTSWRR